TAGQAVVWYGGQFYVRFFLLQTLKVDADTADWLVALSLILATPFFIVFGAMSDKIGRKAIVLAGCLIAALTYFPIFKALTPQATPALEAAPQSTPVSVLADRATCPPQFDPIGGAKFPSSCDLVVTQIVKSGIAYTKTDAPAGTVASVKVGNNPPIA